PACAGPHAVPGPLRAGGGWPVHVEIPPSHDRMAVLQRVLPWLPLLLALSASSPFRVGQARAGVADTQLQGRHMG
ncbi:glutamate-cysteine ligase family protein, partial [Pseudomonas aeruginosa]